MAKGRPVQPLGTYGAISCTPQPNGKVVAATRLRLENGQYKKVRATGKSENDAENNLKTKIIEILKAGETLEVHTNSTLAELIEFWENSPRDLAPKSIATYAKVVRLHIKPKIGALRLREVTTARLQAFLNSLPAGTAKTARAVLGNAIGEAVRLGAMNTNPVRDTKLPKRKKKEVNALTDAEMDEMRAVVKEWVGGNRFGPPRGELLVEVLDLLRGSGLRIGEALGLRWQDVDLENGIISVYGTTDDKGGRQDYPKTTLSRRRIPVAPVAVEALKRQAKKPYHDVMGDIVFPTSTGKFWTVQNFETRLRDARGELKIKPHDYRKTVSTRIEAKYGLLAASRYLGHSNTLVTQQAYLAVPEVQPDYADAFG